MALANLIGTPVEKLTLAALNLLEGREADAPLVIYEEYHAQANRFEEYTGRYVSGEGMDMSITVEDSVLTLINNTAIFASDKGVKYPLMQIAEDYFLARTDGSELTIGFTNGDDGKVKALAYGYRQIPKVLATEV